MIRRILSIIVTLGFLGFNTVHAQTATDALRYSVFDVGGTARTVGVGGGIGALGADFSVLSTNPAGLGMFRRSEFTVTPSLFFSKVSSTLENDANGFSIDETESNFNLNNFGVVVASRPRRGSWTTFNFGIGLNRVANFNQQFFFEGTSTGSIVNRFQELANSDAGLDDFESGLAVDAFALFIDENFDPNFYLSDFDDYPDAQIFRNQIVQSSGSINELVFSFAGNYDEKIIVGATVGVPFLNFTQEKTYREVDPGDQQFGNVPFFDDLEFIENLTTTGTGINFKMGFILRVNQMVRVGGAFHTPTAFRLEDSFSTTFEYNGTDENTGDTFGDRVDSPNGLFDYRLRTPWRFIGSAGFLFQKAGFLTGEIEYVDYSNANFVYDGFESSEREVNTEIQQTLTSALNIKVGGEFAYEILRFRAGVGFHQSPLEGDDTINNSFSLGAGIRQKSFFLDLAYRHFSLQETYVPYLTSQAAPQFVDNDISQNSFLATLGFKF